MIKKASLKFSVETVDDVPELRFNRWWPLHYKKTTLSVWEKFQRNLKSLFPLLSGCRFVQLGYPGQVITEQFIDGASTEKFNLLHTQAYNKNLALSPELAYPSKQVPINGGEIGDVLKVNKYIPAKYSEFYGQRKEKKKLKIICRTKTNERNKKKILLQCTTNWIEQSCPYYKNVKSKNLMPPVRLELTTTCLLDQCSTTKLKR